MNKILPAIFCACMLVSSSVYATLCIENKTQGTDLAWGGWPTAQPVSKFIGSGEKICIQDGKKFFIIKRINKEETEKVCNTAYTNVSTQEHHYSITQEVLQGHPQCPSSP
ncbi:hypothetical protein BH10PSE19_BH10PSE19_14910 [soil metagenome]